MNPVIHAVSAFALCSVLASLGCGRGSPESAQAEPATPSQTAQQEAQQPEGPEVIDQAAGERVNPIEASGDDAGDAGNAVDDSDPAEAASESPLTSLPGFSPSPGTEDPTEPESAVRGAAQVLVQVNVFELSPSIPEDLAPIEQFLGGSSANTLSTDEVAAFMEMISAMTASGVVKSISSPRVLVPTSTEATIEITQVGGGQVGGLPTGRSSLLFTVLPMVHPADDEAQPATVGVNYGLKFREADSAFAVLAQDLGLSVGARAGNSGTITVTDQHTFFFVRRVVGDDTDRELLVLVRPQVMHADLTK